MFEKIYLKVRIKSLLRWILYQTDYFWIEIDFKLMQKNCFVQAESRYILRIYLGSTIFE